MVRSRKSREDAYDSDASFFPEDEVFDDVNSAETTDVEDPDEDENVTKNIKDDEDDLVDSVGQWHHRIQGGLGGLQSTQ